MDSTEKQDLLSEQAENYKTIDAAKKQKYFRNKSKNVDSCIETFKKKIKEGPCYICCVCNRMLYKKSIEIDHN